MNDHGFMASVLFPRLLRDVDLCQCNRRRGGGRRAPSTRWGSCRLHRDATARSGNNLWTLKPLVVEAAASSHAFQASAAFPCLMQHGSNYNGLAGATAIIRTAIDERCMQLRVKPILVPLAAFNRLKPTGQVMHQQFNIQQLYVLPTLYLCVLHLSENKQRLVSLAA